jgi:hypothetical protein
MIIRASRFEKDPPVQRQAPLKHFIRRADDLVKRVTAAADLSALLRR